VGHKLKLLPVIAVIAALETIKGQAMSQPKCDVLKAAHDYIDKQYPSFDPTGLKLVMSEAADTWEVTYRLPEHMLGGTPAVTIDKRTCKVVRAIHSQ
jgi:hypothetical protein